MDGYTHQKQRPDGQWMIYRWLYGMWRLERSSFPDESIPESRTIRNFTQVLPSNAANPHDTRDETA